MQQNHQKYYKLNAKIWKKLFENESFDAKYGSTVR